MSAWQHLSGYLYYKQGGALHRFKQKKRMWFLLNDESCLLYYYNNQHEAHRNSQPTGSITIDGAAISLSLSESNQFVIISSSEEYILTAENHESMMIWLLGLQTKRDAFANKITSSGDEKEPKSPTLRSESLSAAFLDKRSRDNPSSDVFRRFSLQTWRDYRRQQDLEIRSAEPLVGGSDSNLLKSHRPRHHSSSDDSVGLPGDEVFGSEDQLNNKHKLLRRMTTDNILTMSTGNLNAPPVMNGTSNGLLPPMGGSQLTSSCGNLLADRKGSDSITPSSSDSALDRCFDVEASARVGELEQELISAKCELAELKNTESSYKTMLEKKETLIRQMERKLSDVNDLKTDKKSVDKRMKEKVRVLQNQNCFLNEEVKRLAKLQQHERTKTYAQECKMDDVYGEIEHWKQDYVFLLQSCISVPTGDLMDGMSVHLYGGETHTKRVQQLLEETRKINPSLPTFERLARSNVHVDKYGFRHSHDSEGLLLHYICCQLQQHYYTHTPKYSEHLEQWRTTLQRGKTKLLDAKDVKQLCRRGIPSQFRTEVWRQLVYHHVRDVMEEKGSHYFINLCNSAHESEFAGRYRKQISLDLLRTMPSNVRFNHIRSEGTRQLQTVLLAFCHHNTTIGYCQGMNFIAGMSLLFLGPEDAFWTLVAMTEKYFVPSYFDQYLSGAQADQYVLKEIVDEKLPRLAAHFKSVDIELSTITLNWFLAVFFDSVPFEVTFTLTVVVQMDILVMGFIIVQSFLYRLNKKEPSDV